MTSAEDDVGAFSVVLFCEDEVGIADEKVVMR
jgi:hypothetical protein